MSPFKYWIRIIRPQQMILGGLATWVAALLSNGPTWVNEAKAWSAAVMALSVVSSSVFHFGANHQVYARKHYDLIIVRKPERLKLTGGIGLLMSIALAQRFLDWECALVMAFNAAVIFFYAKRLDQSWPAKNLVIAGVCVSPLVLGWFTGHRLHPIIPQLAVCAFLVYLSREMCKDVEDMTANRGQRFTIALDLGAPATLLDAGIVLIMAMAILVRTFYIASSDTAVSSLLVLSFWCWGMLAWYLCRFQTLPPMFKQIIDSGIFFVLASLLLVRYQMY